jgi:hypothetical protein
LFTKTPLLQAGCAVDAAGDVGLADAMAELLCDAVGLAVAVVGDGAALVVRLIEVDGAGDGLVIAAELAEVLLDALGAGNGFAVVLVTGDGTGVLVALRVGDGLADFFSGWLFAALLTRWRAARDPACRPLVDLWCAWW